MILAENKMPTAIETENAERAEEDCYKNTLQCQVLNLR